MNRGTLVRILEAFFRKWFLYVLPLVALVVLGIISVSETRAAFTSQGSVFVDVDSFVTARTGVQDGGFGSFLTPAQFASQELNGLIETDVFIESVVESSGVDPEAIRLFFFDTIAEARDAISSRATSENLVQVRVTTADPVLAQRLTIATIDEFVEFKIALDIAESLAAESFFTELAVEYQQDAVDARAAVDDFLVGVPDLEALTPEQQNQLDRLSQEETVAEERYGLTLENVEASRLASLQAETDVRQSLSVVDPPQVPVEGDSSFADDVVILMTYSLVGIVLTLLGPVMAAMASRTVLFPDDLAHLADANVIAVMPQVGKDQFSLSKVTVPEPVRAAAPRDERSQGEPTPFMPDEGRAQPDLGADLTAARSRWSRVGPGARPAGASPDTSGGPGAADDSDPPRRAHA